MELANSPEEFLSRLKALFSRKQKSELFHILSGRGSEEENYQSVTSV